MPLDAKYADEWYDNMGDRVLNHESTAGRLTVLQMCNLFHHYLDPV